LIPKLNLIRLIAVDLKGHGKKTYKTTLETPKDFSDKVKELCDKIAITNVDALIGCLNMFYT